MAGRTLLPDRVRLVGGNKYCSTIIILGASQLDVTHTHAHTHEHDFRSTDTGLTRTGWRNV